jgi:predicted nuclease of predicted toxin-antitoxin system
VNFFLDENFPKPAIRILEAQGHKVFDIRGTIHEGADDGSIFLLAQAENAIFLTTDRDFFHTIPGMYENHSGIIVISLRQPNRKNIIDKLIYVLTHFDFATLHSKVLLLTDKSYSIYQ